MAGKNAAGVEVVARKPMAAIVAGAQAMAAQNSLVQPCNCAASSADYKPMARLLP